MAEAGITQSQLAEGDSTTYAGHEREGCCVATTKGVERQGRGWRLLCNCRDLGGDGKQWKYCGGQRWTDGQRKAGDGMAIAYL